MYKSNKIIVPESFKSSDGKIIVRLKNKITAQSFIEDEEKIVIGAMPIFEISVKNVNKEDIVKELKERIVNSYKKFIINKEPLTHEELVLFYHIKNIKAVDNFRDTKNNTLVLAYDSESFNIKNIILKFNTNCDCFDISKNIELYNDEEYDKLYKRLVNKCNKTKYNKFIIDMPNLYMSKDYNKTKQILDFAKSNDMRLLILLDRSDYCKERFNKIFGNDYDNCIIDKEKYMNPNQTLALYKIKSILFD